MSLFPPRAVNEFKFLRNRQAVVPFSLGAPQRFFSHRVKGRIIRTGGNDLSCFPRSADVILSANSLKDLVLEGECLCSQTIMWGERQEILRKQQSVARLIQRGVINLVVGQLLLKNFSAAT